MSQQEMEFDGTHREGPKSSYGEYTGTPQYESYSTAGSYGQKRSGFGLGKAVSPGYRLALAIVSMGFMLFMTFGILLIGLLAHIDTLTGILFFLLLVCFYAAVVAINIAFNRKH